MYAHSFDDYITGIIVDENFPGNNEQVSEANKQV